MSCYCSCAVGVTANLHSHLRCERRQGREGTTGQNDAANALIHQILHTEARREAPVTQNISCNMQRNKSHLLTVQIVHTLITGLYKENIMILHSVHVTPCNPPTRHAVQRYLVFLMKMKPTHQHSVSFCERWSPDGYEPEPNT